jgi:hypothetical protein
MRQQMKYIFCVVFPILVLLPYKAMGASICGVERADEASARDTVSSEVKNLTMKLKIANFRADTAYMTEMANKLEGRLKLCVSSNSSLSESEKKVERLRQLGKVCGYDCFSQLGRYFLFMATDFKFLSQASALNDAASVEHATAAAAMADRGIFFIEEGLNVLSRQQSATDSATGAEKSNSFNQYVKQSGVMQYVRIRLYMAKGDVWYQSLSNLSITRIAIDSASAINPALATIGEFCTPQNKMACALRYALDYYEQALWLLIEAESDLPAGSQFVSEQMLMSELRNELTSRKNSLNKGHLFLNIDPDIYTSLSFDQLSSVLKPVIAKLADLDARIQSQMTAWKAEQKQNGYNDVDEARLQKEETMALSGHKIGQIESAAQEKVAKLNEERGKLESAASLLQQKQAVAQLKFELERNLRQFDKERAQITARTQQELLTLKKTSLVEAQGKLRWLINVTLTDMNLDLQEAALQAQIIEYDRQLASNAEVVADLQSNITQKRNQISSEEESQKILAEKLTNLNIEIKEKSELNRTSIRANLCNIERETAYIDPTKVSTLPKDPSLQLSCVVDLAGLTPKAQTWANICGPDGLKKKLSDNAISGAIFQSVCVDGNAPPPNVNSPAPFCTDTYKNTVINILNIEDKLAEQEWIRVQDQKTQYLKQIEEMKVTRISLAALDAAVVVAEKGSILAAALPAAIAGTLSGAMTDPSKVAAAAAVNLRTMRDIFLSGANIAQQISEFNARMEDIRNQTDQAMTKIAYQKAIRDQTLMKIGFDARQSNLEVYNQIYQNDITLANCADQVLDFTNELARNVFQYGQLVAQYKNSELADKQAWNEIDILNSQIRQSKLAVSNLKTQIEDNERLIKARRDDDSRLIALKENTSVRIKTVGVTRDRVEALNKDSNKIDDQIIALNDEQRDKIFALEKQDLVYLRDVINGETTRTNTLIGLEQSIRTTLGEAQNTQNQANAILVKANEEITKERQNILNTAYTQSAAGDAAAKDALFLATENDLANLFPGIPDYIQGKKNLLSTANYVLNLMRARYRRISGLASEGFNSSIVKGDLGSGAYITKVDQVVELDQLWTNNSLLNEAPINIEKPIFYIPPNSKFSQQLLATGRVTFQISPRVRGEDFSATKKKMADSGYLTLWNPALDNGNPRLIDAMVRINFGTGDGCLDQSPNFTLVHKGFGFVYPNGTAGTGSLALPAIQVVQSIAASQAFLQTNQMARYEKARMIWDASPRVNTFDAENVGSDAARYIGMPVAATYELILHKHQCSYNGSGLELFMAVATDVPK